MIGDGKVFSGSKFISNVKYDYRAGPNFDRGTTLDEGTYQVRTSGTIYLRIQPPIPLTLDRLTLHMADGRKQDFYTERSDGSCKATGGLY